MNQTSEPKDEMAIFSELAVVLKALKKAGYKEVWINDRNCPHWKNGPGEGVIAAPPQRRNHWPIIWDLPVWGELGYQGSCGNGLPKADQKQMFGMKHLPSGYYDLRKPIHKLMRIK